MPPPRYQAFLNRHAAALGGSKPKGELRAAWQENDRAYRQARRGERFAIGRFHEVTRFAHRIGCHHLLRAPTALGDIVNSEWLRGIVDGAGVVLLASDPDDESNLVRGDGSPTIFAWELQTLGAAGSMTFAGFGLASGVPASAGYERRGVIGDDTDPLRLAPAEMNT